MTICQQPCTELFKLYRKHFPIPQQMLFENYTAGTPLNKANLLNKYTSTLFTVPFLPLYSHQHLTHQIVNDSKVLQLAR